MKDNEVENADLIETINSEKRFNGRMRRVLEHWQSILENHSKKNQKNMIPILASAFTSTNNLKNKVMVFATKLK